MMAVLYITYDSHKGHAPFGGSVAYWELLTYITLSILHMETMIFKKNDYYIRGMSTMEAVFNIIDDNHLLHGACP